jgi:HD-GYP domain-containing protein (c-di-GMP phosphodiesterase class II)
MLQKVIIFGSDELINSLHALNLNAYVGLKCHITQKAEDIKNLIKRDPQIKAIVMGLDEEYLELASELSDKFNGKDKFLICYNQDSSKQFKAKSPAGSLFIDNKLDLRSLVRTLGKVLGVTAQMMVKKEVGDYFPLPVKLIEKSKEVKWPIFAYQDDEYRPISKDDIHKENLSTVYVESQNRLRCINFISSHAALFIQKDSPLLDRVHATEMSFENIVSQFSEDPLQGEEIYEIAKSCITTMKDVASQNKDLKNIVDYLLQNKTGYLYTHSVLTSFVAKAILKQQTWSNKDQEMKMEMACFFHDMFLVPIYHKYPEVHDEEGLLYNEKLDDQDRTLVATHARLAAEKVSRIKEIPIGVDQIIRQHHGFKSGEGINIAPSTEISPLAKVFQVAEGFVSRFMEVIRYGQKFDKKRQIEFLKEQYNKKSYLPFIECLEVVK